MVFVKKYNPWHTRWFLNFSKRWFAKLWSMSWFLTKPLKLYFLWRNVNENFSILIKRKWKFIKFLKFNQNILKTLQIQEITMWSIHWKSYCGFLIWLYFLSQTFSFSLPICALFAAIKFYYLLFSPFHCYQSLCFWNVCEWDTVGCFSGDTNTTLSSLFMNFGN